MLHSSVKGGRRCPLSAKSSFELHLVCKDDLPCFFLLEEDVPCKTPKLSSSSSSDKHPIRIGSAKNYKRTQHTRVANHVIEGTLCMTSAAQTLESYLRLSHLVRSRPIKFCKVQASHVL